MSTKPSNPPVADVSKAGEKEDLGTLIYRESQLRKKEAAAADAVKKSERSSLASTYRSRRAAVAATHKGGVCIKRGAKRKRCTSEGSTNHVKNRGVCIKHGAKVKIYLCSRDGCTNRVQRRGLCRRHGAMPKGK